MLHTVCRILYALFSQNQLCVFVLDRRSKFSVHNWSTRNPFAMKGARNFFQSTIAVTAMLFTKSPFSIQCNRRAMRAFGRYKKPEEDHSLWSIGIPTLSQNICISFKSAHGFTITLDRKWTFGEQHCCYSNCTLKTEKRPSESGQPLPR